jgi:hypothetical protein
MPGLNRFLRVTPGGLLRIDKKKITSEANLDGKYLLRCSDPDLSAEDIALGYKQLLQVERGWRDMKTTLELRPVYHRLEDRIRAHVILCWLALLLIRIAETTTDQTWANLREDLQELHVGTFEGPAGTFRQRTELTTEQRDIPQQARLRVLIAEMQWVHQGLVAWKVPTHREQLMRGEVHVLVVHDEDGPKVRQGGELPTKKPHQSRGTVGS